MTTEKGPYVKVYQSIVDDPMFVGVFDNDALLATWLRMLLVADAMYPATAPLPRRKPAVSRLLASGLVEERPSNRYVLRGLEAERERRSDAGRNAAAVRWQSGRNADPMPSKAEQSRTEQSKVNGNAPASMIRWTPRDPEGGAGLWHGKGAHDGRHHDCGVCDPLHPDNCSQCASDQPIPTPSSEKEGSA